LRNLLPELALMECKITLTTCRSAPKGEMVTISPDIDLRVFSSFGPHRLAYSKELWSFLATQANSVDIIHSHGLWQDPSRAAAWAARQLAIPHIITTNGHLDPWSLRQSWFRKRIAMALFQSRSLREASLLHGKGDLEIDGFRCLGLPGPFAMIPNGVAGEILDHPTCSGFAADRWPVLKGRHILLSLGRLHYVKGFQWGLRAFARIKRIGHDWCYVIAGPDSGGYQAELEYEAERLGIRKSVVFMGPVYGKDKIALLDLADLVLTPSFHENFGIVIAEGLARGKPVITTQATPWRLLQSHRCGWWVPAEENAIIQALQEAITTSPQERCEMGARGKTLVKDRFNWPMVAQQTLAVYKWLVKQGPRPQCVMMG
jgi:glycosyltransferase involved in cell wall biosynthesis